MRTLGLALFILGFGAAGCGASAPEQTTNQQQHLGACGGLGGIQCPSGQTCVDDPNDSCDPQNGGADCGGICVTP